MKYPLHVRKNTRQENINTRNCFVQISSNDIFILITIIFNYCLYYYHPLQSTRSISLFSEKLFGGSSSSNTNPQTTTEVKSTDSTTIAGTKQNGTLDDDNIRGSEQNDILVGLAGNDIITGQAGDDNIDGSEGMDYIIGIWN